MIRYTPFWKTMAKKGFTTYTLREHYKVSHGTVQRLQRNMSITTDTIDRLCKILDCGLEDVLEYIPDPVEEDETR